MKALISLEPTQRKAFRDKYLAAVLAVAALFISTFGSAQSDSLKYSPINGYGFKYKRHIQDSVAAMPLSTSPHTPYRKGGYRYNITDSCLQLWTGTQWIKDIRATQLTDTSFQIGDSVITIHGAGGGGGGGITELTGPITAGPGSGSQVTSITDNAIQKIKLEQSPGLSVIGNIGNTTDDVGNIVAANDGNVLRRFGTSLGFGAINLASSNAVTGNLPVTNGGTGTATPGLIAGTNITSITGTWPNQTINAAGGGSADSTTFAPNYRVDTAKINLRTQIAAKLNISDTSSMLSPYLRKIDTTAKWVTRTYRKAGSDSVFYVKGGLSIFSHRDSIGSGSGAPTNIYYYPETYGAVADSSTDCTSAVRLAIAAMGRYGGILQFSQGNYVISDSIIIPSNVTVAGVAGNANTSNIVNPPDSFYKGSSTNILFRGGSKNCFVAGIGGAIHYKAGMNFRDFNLRYQGSTPTAGAGISIVDGGNYSMEKITVTGFFDDVYQHIATYATVHNCVFGEFARFGFSYNNEWVPDWSDISLSDCFFYSGQNYLRPRACFHSSSPGGVRIVNIKTNLGVYDSTKIVRYAIELNDSTGWSQDVLIENCSLESFYVSGIKMNFKGSPNKQRLIGLNNIQTYTIFPAIAPAIDISYATSGLGANAGLIMLDNILTYDAGDDFGGIGVAPYPGVKVRFAPGLQVGKIIAYNYQQKISTYMCSGEKYTYVLDRYDSDSLRTTLYSPGEMRIISDSSRFSGGGDPIMFLQGGYGSTAQALAIDYLHRIVAYTSTGDADAWLYVRKDTATNVSMTIANNNTGSGASAAVSLNAAGASAANKLIVYGSGSTGSGIIGPGDFGMLAAGHDIALNSSGSSNVVKIGNGSQELCRFTNGGILFGSTTNDGLSYQQITYSGGPQLSLRSDATFGTTLRTTGGGIFDINPTAKTTRLAASSIYGASLNLTNSAGVSPSAPNSGDMWWQGTNLYFYDGSSYHDLLAPGSANISNTSLTASGSYTQDWNHYPLTFNNVNQWSFNVKENDGVFGTRKVKHVFQTSNNYNSQPLNLYTSIRNLADNADSILTGYRNYASAGLQYSGLVTTSSASTGRVEIGLFDANMTIGKSSKISGISLDTTRLSLFGQDSIIIKGAYSSSTADSILAIGPSLADASNKVIKVPLRPYKPYTALLTQSGTSAPTATVLGTNTIGTIVWTRSSGGIYVGTLTGAFPANKTWATVGWSDESAGGNIVFRLKRTGNNTVELLTSMDGVNGSDVFTNLSIEIRVYP